MQIWTGVALAVAGWFVPLVLCSGGNTVTTASYTKDDLEETVCSPFEVLKPSEPCCEPTCVDDCSHAICRRAPEGGSVPTCVCRQGYVRHNGGCIRKDSCPTSRKNQNSYAAYGSYDSYRPVPHTKPGPARQKTCNRNEQLTQCRPYCEATCEKDCTGVPVPKKCIPEPSCVCKDGFVRQKGHCIQKSSCPNRKPLLGRPLSGEYIDFEVVSLEGMKSDEDFDYRVHDERDGGKPSTFSRYEKKKHPMVPVYLRTVTSAPKASGSCGCKVQATEKPALFPPLCACRGKHQTHAPTYAPKLEERPSYESTEEDCDIVPYVPLPSSSPPLPSTRAYERNPSFSRFPPNAHPTPRAYYAQRKPVAPVPPVHKVDFNEPLDHFCGSGQATSAQQSSAGQEDYRKPLTIWPPVTCSCKRCSMNRKQR